MDFKPFLEHWSTDDTGLGGVARLILDIPDISFEVAEYQLFKQLDSTLETTDFKDRWNELKQVYLEQ